jgi:hypothetical protein
MDEQVDIALISARMAVFVDKANEINARYDNDRRVKDSWGSWTPKQRRRVYKQKAKWHRRLLGEWRNGIRR